MNACSWSAPTANAMMRCLRRWRTTCGRDRERIVHEAHACDGAGEVGTDTSDRRPPPSAGPPEGGSGVRAGSGRADRARAQPVALIVQKYGGTSVGTVERIKAVARRVAATRAAGNQVIVVVSAMAGETNRLLELAQRAVAAARRARGRRAAGHRRAGVGRRCWPWRCWISACRRARCSAIRSAYRTDGVFGRARIRSIDAQNMLERASNDGGVAVVAGFPGRRRGPQHHHPRARRQRHQRGGDGGGRQGRRLRDLHRRRRASTPPIRASARRRASWTRISFDEMLELASLGAKVLQIRSVEFAKRYNVPVHVRSSFSDEPGTWVVQEDASMEDVLVSGVAHDLERGEDHAAARAGPARAGDQDLHADRQGAHRRRHDHPERQRGRLHRPDLHRAARRLPEGARHGAGGGEGDRRAAA